MIDDSQLTKRYYSISEVAKLFGVANSLLRFWEGEFNQLKPAKTKNGIRKYTKVDIRIIESIYDLVKGRGFTIEGAKKELKSAKKVPPTKSIVQKLIKIKSRLEKIKRALG